MPHLFTWVLLAAIFILKEGVRSVRDSAEAWAAEKGKTGSGEMVSEMMLGINNWLPHVASQLPPGIGECPCTPINVAAFFCPCFIEQ